MNRRDPSEVANHHAPLNAKENAINRLIKMSCRVVYGYVRVRVRCIFYGRAFRSLGAGGRGGCNTATNRKYQSYLNLKLAAPKR